VKFSPNRRNYNKDRQRRPTGGDIMLGSFLLRLARVFAVVAGLVAPAAAQYPNRPITLIVPWGAGGGTDATARILASILEKDLKQPVNVVNRTGGSGVVGHSAIAEAPPDVLHDRADHGRDRHDALAGNSPN